MISYATATKSSQGHSIELEHHRHRPGPGSGNRKQDSLKLTAVTVSFINLREHKSAVPRGKQNFLVHAHASSHSQSQLRVQYQISDIDSTLLPPQRPSNQMDEAWQHPLLLEKKYVAKARGKVGGSPRSRDN
eukprot:scaffold7202_cov109-Skeletonema_dohrnii-CCMP3373.AAC.1